MILCL